MHGLCRGRVQTASDWDASAFVQQLCQLNGELSLAHGDALSDAKKAVTDYVTTQMQLALGDNYPNAVKQRYFGADAVPGHNVEAYLDNPDSDKLVVIGAHYDAVGQGANDNACGVAALLQIAYALADKSLPFDVALVAFDCEEDGLVGSSVYVAEQMAVDPQNVLLMFNIDSIALGQNLYLMCENKPTDMADLILSKCDSLVEKPHALGVNNYTDNFGYNYYEFVQGSDHTPFRLQNIPIAAFFAGSYNYLGYQGGTEMNSSDDTFANLQSSDYLVRIDDVSNAVVGTLTDADFVSAAQNARSQMVDNDAVYNGWWPSLAVLGVLVVLAVFTWLYYRKLQKKALLGTAEAKQTNVFGKPQAEDIFSFDPNARPQNADDPNSGSDSDGQDDSDDIDGIFTFKK